jgi:hypothetical protein
MDNHDTELSRPEFLKLAITKATPFLLALAAVLVGLFVYDIFQSSNPGFQVFLIFVLLLLFFYPILKRRYGERI